MSAPGPPSDQVLEQFDPLTMSDHSQGSGNKLDQSHDISRKPEDKTSTECDQLTSSGLKSTTDTDTKTSTSTTTPIFDHVTNATPTPSLVSETKPMAVPSTECQLTSSGLKSTTDTDTTSITTPIFDHVTNAMPTPSLVSETKPMAVPSTECQLTSSGSKSTTDTDTTSTTTPIFDHVTNAMLTPSLVSETKPMAVPSTECRLTSSGSKSTTDTDTTSTTAPIIDHVTNATPTPSLVNETKPMAVPSTEGDDSSSKKKKKKKKHKRHSSNQSARKSPAPGKGSSHMTSEEINTDISEIDKFLATLRMGTGNAVPAPPPPITTKTTTTTTITTNTGGTGMKSGSVGLALIQQLESSSGSSSSSSDSDSSSDSSDDDEGANNMITIEEGRDDGDDDERGKETGRDSNHPLIKNEISYKELPPLESCNVTFPQGASLMPLGKVSHITEQLVIIQSFPETPPVDEGTVLWTETKKSISVIFEIFGPVKSPLYSVHVQSMEHAHALGLDPGKIVNVVQGNPEVTKYVFTQQLMQQHGSDASWKDDAEVPEQFQDFSDDEAEQQRNRNKRGGKRDSKGSTTPSSQHHIPSSKPLEEVPRYSHDPKMSAYFPRARPPPPPAPQHATPTPYMQTPALALMLQGGTAYLTPRGFMGLLPPGRYAYPPLPMGTPSPWGHHGYPPPPPQGGDLHLPPPTHPYPPSSQPPQMMNPPRPFYPPMQ